MWFAVLELPDLSLQALRRRGVADAGAAAVAAEDGGAGRVRCANAAARERGVVPGMRPPQAMARCPGLRWLERSREAEAAAGRVLLLLAESLAPRLEYTESGRVTVDLRGTDVAEAEARCREVCARARAHELEVRIGIAGTPEHALWAAGRAAPVWRVDTPDELLERLPLSVAVPDRGTADVLAGWGVRTPAGLARLPRAAVGARLGRAGLELWDTVAGRRVRPLRLHVPSPRFVRKLEPEHRIETLEALCFVLRRFVDELALELRAAHSAASALDLRLALEGGGAWTRRIEAPEPTTAADTLFRVLEASLEGARTERPVAGVELRLRAETAVAHQGDLFAVVMEDTAGFARTADRIAAIVGNGRSGSPRPEDTWRPDAFRMERLGTSVDAAEAGGAEEMLVTGPPLDRVRPPRPLRVWTGGGVPVYVEGADCAGAVADRAGPWRLSGGWWEASGWSREEWDVELDGGGVYRIFRDADGWHLEGVYG